jgi:starch synthase (maltosyl-transferring)
VGSVDRWSQHLPRIAAMGFDWVYVNPFHATGESGSLYAVKDYYRMNPLFRGDAKGSDDDLLRAFVSDAAAHGIAVMMDLVVNHTARDAALTREHPEWYRLDAGGDVVAPSATDPDDPEKVTVWTDLGELDWSERPARTAMLAYFRDVVRHYAQLGIRGFRCDAAYKVPAPVWAELRAAARAVDPQIVFAAENLGASMDAVLALRSAGFDYLFNSSKWWDFSSPWLLEQYERFRHIAPSIAFPESHDTPRLAAERDGMPVAELENEYKFRYLFAAFFSSGVMIPIGYEYGFDRAFDVVMTRPEHWQAPRFDISGFIAQVNAMKAAVPALNEEGPERAILSESNALALLRRETAGGGAALALLNPSDAETSVDARALLPALDGADALVDVTPPNGKRRPFGEEQRLVLRPHELRVFAAPVSSPNGKRRLAGAAEAVTHARAVVIEGVWPEIDAGRHPVKRIVGERFEVQADVFREGHDLIAGVLKFRERGASAWRETPLEPLDNDRWRGAFTLERNARYVYTLEAWPDLFGTWRHDVERKREAGQAIDLELIEGRALVDAARARASEADRARLDAALRDADARAGAGERAAVLLAPELAAVMARAPDRSRATVYARELEVIADRSAARFAAWYEMFPRSQAAAPGAHGTFADAAKRLPAIRAMGFDVVYLPPIHPIGHAFRKGKNNSLDPRPDDPGSPWAIGNGDGGHTSVHPQLGTLEDFERFVQAARANDLEVALDYALQASQDHPYVREHPEWFQFRPDGSIKYAENPPKKYQDIVNFDWFGANATPLWTELRDVIEFWVGHGVRTFRVDNPHTKPFDFWEWMIGDVQSRHPDVLFLAEAFTRPKVMKALAKRGFSQSYTYFTWRNFKDEIRAYVEELAYSEMAEYYRPNFWPNTPDILPPFLQSGGRPAFRIRLVLAATLASLYGIYSGYELCENAALAGREEYADSEKYELKHRDFAAPGNIVADVTRINAIRRENPALHDWRNVRFLRADHENVLFYAKSAGTNTLLIAVNLDPAHAASVALHLPLGDLGIREGETFACEELLGGERFMWRGAVQTLTLDPKSNPAAILRIDGRMRVDYENPCS